MKLNFTDIDDFFSFIPLLIAVGISNDDYMDDAAAEFYGRLDKKIRVELKKWFLENPSYRQQLKRFTSGLENGENIVMTINDKSIETEQEQITQYLTEDYKPMTETVKKYMGDKLNG